MPPTQAHAAQLSLGRQKFCLEEESYRFVWLISTKQATYLNFYLPKLIFQRILK